MPSFSVSNTLIESRIRKMDVLTLSVVFVTACVFCCNLSAAAPVITTEDKAMMYLQKYGYMEEANSSSSRDYALLSEAIKDFQRFAGLNENGLLDEPTLKLMNMPRCGVRDKVSGSSRRNKRYAHEGSKWEGENLVYKITKYPSSITDRAKVDKEIAKAFEVWSNVTGLSFEVCYADSCLFDIEISFEVGKHIDVYPFDGPGGELAHAFFPQYGGDAHFDDDEEWTIDLFSGKILFQVAAHEFGHSLGLQHSRIKAAVMYPLHYNRHDFTLDKDDILGIQKLYGPPKREIPPKPESEPDVSRAPDLCKDSSIDAAVVTEDKRTYFFKGDYYWEIDDEIGIIEGYPRKISEDWPGLPGNLDAAWTDRDGRTFFFKKDEFFMFRNKIDSFSGYASDIGFTSDMDAVFTGKQNILVFKGDKYWAYEGRIPVSSIHPLSISLWKGLPNNIDAGFQWTNNNIYIFKGNEYYRISEKTKSVENADPPYPRSISDWWLKCEEVPDLCQDSSIDAATTTGHGQNDTFYVFKGNFYWEIGGTGISDGYPRKIFNNWSGLPGDLDAALTWKNGKTFFFKKNLYWRFHNTKMDSGYPKEISTGFPGIPDDIDSAFVWNLNEKTYFFKGDKYWRFESENSSEISSRYPQPISNNWEGLPNNIDAALWWRNNTFFFKGGQYYKLNAKTPSVDIPESPYPSYPRSTYSFVFDCEGWKKMKVDGLE